MVYVKQWVIGHGIAFGGWYRRWTLNRWNRYD